MWMLVGGVILALVFSYLLKAAEMAFRRMSPSHVKALLDDERHGAEQLRRITEDSAAYLSVTSFCRTTLEMTAAVLATMGFATIYGAAWQTYAYSILVMVVASFVIVGVSPATIGIQHAETISLWSAPWVVRLRRLLAPVSRLLIAFGNAVTPGKGYVDGPFESEAELRDLVDLAGESSIIAEGERSMLHSVIDLGDTVVREVMVPRTDMITIARTKNLSQAMSLFLRSGFSRVPVIGENSDDPLGLLYFKDVAGRIHMDHEANWLPVTDLMRPVPFVPESKSADLLLQEMQRDQTHMALVVDEYGGTAGLVTIEDIIEEIVGEISDEHDPEERRVEDLGEGRKRIPAELPIDDLETLYDITLDPEEIDDVDTVGGLLGKALGRVPILGSSATIGGLELTADRMSGRKHRIDTLIVAPAPPVDTTNETPTDNAPAPAGSVDQNKEHH
ncbi:HlyC/CorC family transporter [Dermatophilus congolensis]|uniref:Magnesium and cobalt efflux protein CorC n=2 Tax=Dermatophilus congolensis TaxID=1863 RepID=A0AA46BMP7_9MICO|nr:HlyC/CorC family transporter [Dermatophilus congolensis]MBO3151673.1 HlyC/CorC family transporter [Dermatophilus congolensis]MBO3161327.1 HlyC/CorC family transporter [Dermatophilus congolensis]MBO3162954.1 HlyC/CorC family transporter [Dermatophilus congolensis]MBO3176506.1 HlyC/CorC family transporter [Dermatophilus congolensis]